MVSLTLTSLHILLKFKINLIINLMKRQNPKISQPKFSTTRPRKGIRKNYPAKEKNYGNNPNQPKRPPFASTSQPDQSDISSSSSASSYSSSYSSDFSYIDNLPDDPSILAPYSFKQSIDPHDKTQSMLSVFKVYTYQTSVGLPNSQLLMGNTINGQFATVGQNYFTRLGLVDYNIPTNAYVQYLNLSFTIYASFLVLLRKVNCARSRDFSNSTKLGTVFSADVVDNYKTHGVVYVDEDAAYGQHIRDYNISPNNWREYWLPLLSNVYLTPHCINNIKDLYGQYICLGDVATITPYLDISTHLFTLASTQADVLTAFSDIYRDISEIISENPNLTSILQQFGCVNVLNQEYDNLNKLDPSRSNINYRYDNDGLFANSFFNWILDYDRAKSRVILDNKYLSNYINSTYSLEHLDLTPYDPDNIKNLTIREISLRTFSIMDRFRMHGCECKIAFGYRRKDGVSSSYYTQVPVPGSININEKFTGQDIGTVIGHFKWFTEVMRHSAMHLPRFQYSAKYSYNDDQVGNPGFSFSFDGDDNDILLTEDVNTIILYNYQYFRLVCEIEFFFKNHDKLFMEVENSTSGPINFKF